MVFTCSSSKQTMDIKYPIISAPMAFVAGGELAAQVCLAGGLGLIGAGYSDEQWLQQQINVAKPREFGVGFITWRLHDNRQQLSLALEKRAKAIMLSFGDIAPFVDEIKAYNIPLICQVQSVEDAIDCYQKGADIIIAQGTEAGGHGCDTKLYDLLPKVLASVPVPVFAAGGICDATAIKAALNAGAKGVLMGTRFMASKESRAPNGLICTIEHEIKALVRGIDMQ